MNLGEYTDRYGFGCVDCGDRLNRMDLKQGANRNAIRYECSKHHFVFSTEYVNGSIKDIYALNIYGFLRDIKINEKSITIGIHSRASSYPHVSIYVDGKTRYIEYRDINKWLVPNKEFEIILTKYLILI